MRLTSFVIVGLLTITIIGCKKDKFDSGQIFKQGAAYKLLSDSGVIWNKLPDHLQEPCFQLFDAVLTTEDINRLKQPDWISRSLFGNVWGNEIRGRYITLQRGFGPSNGNSLHYGLLISSPESIKLRHRIKIGSDYAKWQFFKHVTTYPHDGPFERIYLVAQREDLTGRKLGIVFYESIMATLEIESIESDTTLKILDELTMIMASNIRQYYDELIRPVAGDDLLRRDTVLTRNDLPDPDTMKMVLRRL